MTDFTWRPDCPICENSDGVTVESCVSREGGPGEFYLCVCAECKLSFTAVMPEPDDGYLGDGIFAKNH